MATVSNSFGQCDTAAWTGITDAEAGWSHTFGIRGDGTVVATGRSQYGQCNVTGWTDVIAISRGSVHTIGLRSDGTATVAGAWWDEAPLAHMPFSAVLTWTGLDQVSSQGDFIVGLVR